MRTRFFGAADAAEAAALTAVVGGMLWDAGLLRYCTGTVRDDVCRLLLRGVKKDDDEVVVAKANE